ncbi:hypothetical protein [Pectobacterium carotovorum]|uniref:hypothetical protein n=1 Tax=Pectobacterium carotovorum TaxID=554 RepID=UPI0021F3A94C|nr:hypothetical protein [Pectobacterium carotovorum]
MWEPVGPLRANLLPAFRLQPQEDPAEYRKQRSEKGGEGGGTLLTIAAVALLYRLPGGRDEKEAQDPAHTPLSLT